MRLLILSDVRGNWPALEAVLQAEPDDDALAFCSDVVDYGPQPPAVHSPAGGKRHLRSPWES